MTRRLGIPNLCLKNMHLPLELTPEEVKNEVTKVKTAGINLFRSGVIYMKTLEDVELLISQDSLRCYSKKTIQR